MPKKIIRYNSAKSIVGNVTLNKYVRRALNKRIKREGWQHDPSKPYTGFK